MRVRAGVWLIVASSLAWCAGGTSEAQVPAGEPLTIQWKVLSEGVAGSDGTTYYRVPVRVSFAVTGVDPGKAAIEWSGNGVAWQPAGEVVSVPGGSAHVRAVSADGRTASTVASWPVDTVAPTIALRFGDRRIDASERELRVREGDVLPLVLDDAGAGIDSVRAYLGEKPVDYAVKGGPWQPAPHGVRFSIKGTYVVQVEATDRVGNVSRVMWKAVVKKAARRQVPAPPAGPAAPRP